MFISYLISFYCNIVVDDSSSMEMSHNHSEEDIDNGSVQNSMYIVLYTMCIMTPYNYYIN